MLLTVRKKLLLIDIIFVITLTAVQLLVFSTIVPILIKSVAPEKVVLSFMLLLIWLVLYNTISLYVFLKPFKNIKQYLKKIGKGDLSTKIPVSNDEIGEVMQEINLMTKNLKKHISTINKAQKLKQRKSEFVVISSHQLRTPLTSIKWAVLNLIKNSGKLNKNQKEILMMIKDASDQSLSLAEQLLAVAREEATNHIASQQKNVDLHVTTQDVLKNFNYLIKNKNVFTDYKKNKAVPNITANPAKIKSVVQCLLENAITYASTNTTINIILTTKEEAVQFSVTNIGFGISPAEKNKIFTKFYRGKQALETKTAGTGLGLYLSKNIINNLGGELWFTSTPKKKTTFYFSVPFDSKVKVGRFLKSF
jgi:signal transduction histidine kinase|tara:strand:+ start:6201 stop:7292 length:1092 start_codon:yes stop_codon:yes gene_type:complete